MTREEITKTYTVNEHGTICSPGKFEGEPVYAPHFQEWANDGEVLSYMEDGCGNFVSLMDIDDDDRAAFPELGSSLYVVITETDQGFVYCETLDTEEQADKLREECEPEDDEDEDQDEDEDTHP